MAKEKKEPVHFSLVIYTVCKGEFTYKTCLDSCKMKQIPAQLGKSKELYRVTWREVSHRY